MHIDNGTEFQCAFTGALDPSGREHVVLVVKGTFEFSDSPGSGCRFADFQKPLIMADEFTGEAGDSSPRAEMDFAHTKRSCDFLLDATAHAPGGRPIERTRVGVALGQWVKSFDVVGNRVWLSGPTGPRASDIRPFAKMPLSYDIAFGGTDRSDPSDKLPFVYLRNPVGRGWHRIENITRLTGQPMPNIEVSGRPVTSPWDDYPPISLGPLGRGWPDRLRYAGTYDQQWLDTTFPFLPTDFDVRYYQGAPNDQQIAFPTGGEDVKLVNLTPGGKVSFKLPDARMPVLFSRRRAEDVAVNAPLDTVFIEPESLSLSLTWRASLPLERDIFEVSECIVGPRSKTFWRARKLGKTYYPSLKALPKKESAE